MITTSLIQKDGKLHKQYQKYPFDIDKVCSYVNGGVLSCHVISNLKVKTESNSNDWEFQGLQGLLSGSQVPLSQGSQISQLPQLSQNINSNSQNLPFHSPLSQQSLLQQCFAMNLSQNSNV